MVFKSKSSEGVSAFMILLWCQGDFFSLLGSLLLKLERMLIAIGWYHMMVSLFTFYIVLFYNNKGYTKIHIVSLVIISMMMIGVSLTVHILMENREAKDLTGEVIGWTSAGFYIIGRFPQLYMNFKRKSIEGLSLNMYLFSMAGNVCYVASILTLSVEWEYIRINLPWIVLVVGILFLDIVLLCQWGIYKNPSRIISLRV